MFLTIEFGRQNRSLNMHHTTLVYLRWFSYIWDLNWYQFRRLSKIWLRWTICLSNILEWIMTANFLTFDLTCHIIGCTDCASFVLVIVLSSSNRRTANTAVAVRLSGHCHMTIATPISQFLLLVGFANVHNLAWINNISDKIYFIIVEKKLK